MELGEKLKQARLEAGLSQRQLCGDTITRNMLSQIENGSAKPSFATLQVLSARLGKPISYFWEQAPSENLSLLNSASRKNPKEALEILEKYLPEDPQLDTGYHLLSCRCYMELAQQAIADNRSGYAATLLEQAQHHGNLCPELDHIFRRRLTLLQFLVQKEDARTLSAALPDNTEEMLLRATAALQCNDPEKCLCYLSVADRQSPEIRLLQGDAHIQLKQYEAAVSCLTALDGSKDIYSRLELGHRELGDYKKAYEYACMQR